VRKCPSNSRQSWQRLKLRLTLRIEQRADHQHTPCWLARRQCITWKVCMFSLADHPLFSLSSLARLLMLYSAARVADLHNLGNECATPAPNGASKSWIARMMWLSPKMRLQFHPASGAIAFNSVSLGYGETYCVARYRSSHRSESDRRPRSGTGACKAAVSFVPRFYDPRRLDHSRRRDLRELQKGLCGPRSRSVLQTRCFFNNSAREQLLIAGADATKKNSAMQRAAQAAD